MFDAAHSHDTGSWLPEADSVFGAGGSKEVVDLLVDVDSPGEILDTTDLGLNQVVTVDGRGDSGLGETGGHELENSHLGGGILASNSLKISGCTAKQEVGTLTSGRSFK